MNKTVFIIQIMAVGYIASVLEVNHYTTDWGNGVIIQADKYVRSGAWVYDCKGSFLISRIPRDILLENLVDRSKIETNLTHLPSEKKKFAEELIKAYLAAPNWHQNLRYTRTNLYEDSRIADHDFEATTRHKEISWKLILSQPDKLEKDNRYLITATPHDPASHKTYETLLKEARVSCPKPQ
jgi:hypothetical protein